MSKRKWTNQDLIEAVKKSIHITEVMKTLGINHSSNNANTVKKYIKELELSTNHWLNELTRKKREKFETPIEEVFCINSTYTKSHLKDKILKHQLLDYKCSICNILPFWNNQTLTLQIDHMNGNNTDHRLENLRFLCPNCHSQTNNYAGGNALNRKKKETYTCIVCTKYRSRVSSSGMCNQCRASQDRIAWPNDEELKEMIRQSNINKVAKKLGVSHSAITKRLKKLNINY